MKKLVSLFLVATALLTQFSLNAFAQADEFLILANGEKIQLSVPPVTVNDRTLIPVRDISEKFGAEVIWDGAKRTVDITKDNEHITLTIDSDIVRKNNEEIITDVPSTIINDKTMVPLRAVFENIGINVDWYMLDLWYTDKNNEITINKKTGVIDTYDKNNDNLSIKECMDIASEKVRKDITISEDELKEYNEMCKEASIESNLYKPGFEDFSDDCYLISVGMTEYVVLVSVNKYNGNAEIVCDGTQDYWHGMIDF